MGERIEYSGDAWKPAGQADGTTSAPFSVIPREDATQPGAVTGAITANGQTVILPLAGYNGAVFAWWGTFSAISLAFETSYDGGTVYVSAAASPVAGGSSATASGSSSTASAWDIYAPGATHVRIRATAYSSGTMNVRAIPIALASDPAPSIGTVNTVTTVTTVASVTALSATNVSAGSGGLTLTNRLLSAAAGLNATSVKGSAGRLYKITGYNAASSLRYLKIYNTVSAPGVGTNTPVATFALAPEAAFDIDFIPVGMYFTTGIGFGLTTGSADADTGVLTAGDIVGMNLFYI